MFFVDLITAVLVRVVLLTHSLLVVWLATTMTKRTEYWILAAPTLAMLVEAVVTIVRNKAQEWKWFCPCFLAYLCSTIPGIWVLELKKTDMFHENFNLSATSMFGKIQGINMPTDVDIQTLVTVMEQLFLYLMILSRWILPRGEITRNELSQLLFVFIGIASDITEFFALSEENAIRQSAELTYSILAVWTLSMLQFTFVLTATHSPKKRRVALASGVRDIDEEQESCVKSFFKTEVWSICINFLFQDGPFLSVRLYTMIAKGFLNYSIIFFTAKNALLVMLLVYRLSVLCFERSHHKADDESHMTSMTSKPSMVDSESKQSVGKVAVINRSLHNSNASLSNEIDKSDLAV